MRLIKYNNSRFYNSSIVLYENRLEKIDVNGTNSAQLSKFSVAAWFKTSTDYNSGAFIVNKAGASDKLNYGMWITNVEKIRSALKLQAGVLSTQHLHYHIASETGITQ